MKIGIDLDNTLIDYRSLLGRLAGTTPAGGPPRSKEAIRAEVVAADGDDRRWQRIQADAYGTHIAEAHPFDGALAFVDRARSAGHEVHVLSHKTARSVLDPTVELRDAAMGWLERTGFLGEARIPRERVRFFDDRAAKVHAAAAAGLDWLVDDLRDVLEDPALPGGIRRLWFTQGERVAAPEPLVACARWDEVAVLLELRGSLGVEPSAALRSALGASPRAVEDVEQGGNARLRVVVDADGSRRAVKAHPRDGRARAAKEHHALRWMREAGLRCVPEPFACDDAAAVSTTAWVEGRPADGVLSGDAVADACAGFVEELVRAGATAGAFGPASDARFALADYPTAVERRLRDLPPSELVRGLEARARIEIVAFERRAARAGVALDATLDEAERIPSPSDLGPHNMRVDRFGQPWFFDFEYFGWDDPAKLMADFACSAAFTLAPSARDRFCERVASGLPRGGAGALRRLDVIRGLVRFEWILIVARRASGAERASRMLAELGPS